MTKLAQKVTKNVDLILAQAAIEKALPSGSGSAALKDSPTVRELRQLMEQVETIKAERDVIENEIKEAKSDMSEFAVIGIYLIFAASYC